MLLNRRIDVATPHLRRTVQVPPGWPRWKPATSRLCVSTPPNLSALSRPKLEAVVAGFMDEIAALKQVVSEQREEIARLKGLKGRPDVKPSGMDNATKPANPL